MSKLPLHVAEILSKAVITAIIVFFNEDQKTPKKYSNSSISLIIPSYPAIPFPSLGGPNLSLNS
jgi:vesicle coat complex subunit